MEVEEVWVRRVGYYAKYLGDKKRASNELNDVRRRRGGTEGG